MIEYLRGKLVAVLPGRAVLEIGAVGLSLETPEQSGELEQLIGTEVLFYTRLLLRDDDLRVIGFRAAEERDLFNLITGVSGFGPRLALSLLGSLTVAQICTAVLEEDLKTLCQAPGVGQKMGQRLIFELKEKVSRLYTAELPFPAALDSPRLESIEALRSLGYSNSEAAAAVNKAMAAGGGALSGEELLKKALNLLAGGSGEGR